MGEGQVKVQVFGISLLPPAARKPRDISEVCRRVFKSEKARVSGELNVVILDRRRMRLLNKRFLGQGRDTDVIAFNYPQDTGPSRGEKPFGDIFLSAHLARTQAREVGHSVLSEVLFLTAHGALHILGYDDSTSRQRAEMFDKQARALKKGARRS
jgi:probable rRNA maturation factor